MFKLTDVRYLPTKIVDADVTLVPAIGTKRVVDWRMRDIRSDRIIKIEEFWGEENDNISLKYKYDLQEVSETSTYCLERAEFDLTVWNSFHLDLYNRSSSDINNYPYRYAIWIKKRTIADKIAFNVPLTEEEEELAKKHEIRERVDEGQLPLTMKELIKKTTTTIDKRSLTANVTENAEVLRTVSWANTYLVLNEIKIERPDDASDTTELSIITDDREILRLRAYAMTKPAEVFIPAIDELRVHTVNAPSGTTHKVRLTYSYLKRTPRLGVLFGQVAPEKVPEIFKRIRGGLPIELTF